MLGFVHNGYERYQIQKCLRLMRAARAITKMVVVVTMMIASQVTKAVLMENISDDTNGK